MPFTKIRVLFLAALLVVAMTGSVLACAPGSFTVEDQTFFSPEVIGDPSVAPFFAAPDTRFYKQDSMKDSSEVLSAINLDEWEGFFQGAIPRKAWSELLYKAPISRINALILSLKGRTNVTKSPEDDVFAAFKDRASLVAALYYVGFAKRVEPYAIERKDQDGWNGAKQKRNLSLRQRVISNLIVNGERALGASKLPFLRERYAFQLLRLFYFNGEYDHCVTFFDQHRQDFAVGGAVSWRAMGYAAGARYKAKHYAEANYMYSVIFDRYAPMRVTAAWSFHPQEEADWNRCLSEANTVHEKAVLWCLLGLQTNSLKPAKEIYALDPQFDLLPLLVVREVNWAELESNVTDDQQAEGTGSNHPGKPELRKELLAFIETASEKGGVAKPWIWELSAGYLLAMSGQRDLADRWLDKAAKDAPEDVGIQRQIRISRLYAMLQSMKAVNDGDEPALAKELAWLKGEPGDRTSAFFDWATRRLSALYRKKGDEVKAFCLHDVQEDRFYGDSANIDRLIQFLNKPDKSAFDSFAADRYLPAQRSDLVEVKALNALYAGDYDLSAKLFSGIKTGVLRADPFEIHVRDNHDRDAAAKHKDYTKTQFVLRLVDLIGKAGKGGPNAAERYFEAANALYNITWFGNSRVMYETEADHFSRRPRIVDCSRAAAFYKKAMELSTDRELKARACFMLSKCELNSYYIRDPDKKAGDFIAGKYFHVLRDSYGDTKYYQEVIQECGYFKTFISKHPGGGNAVELRR
jgi:hypothetical protein